MYRLLLILFALLTCGVAHAERRVAVLEIQGSEAEPATLAALTDAIRAGALEALPPGYGLMTRENMAALAREMELDLSCIEATAECEVDVGREIGAALVLSARLTRIEGSVLVSLSVHETRSGALLATGSTQATDLLPLIEELRTLGRHVVSAALVKDQPKQPVTATEGQIGQEGKRPSLSGDRRVVVTFESEPPGAVVQVDGKLLCPQTPCSREVRPGPHRVTMQMERHDEVTAVLQLGEGPPVRLSLPARFALLTIDTKPPGLNVQLDGTRMKTPLRSHAVNPGAHEVLIDDPCFAALGERIVVTKGESRSVRLRGERRVAGLDVSAVTPRGDVVVANVSLDGRSLGQTPLEVEVPLCARELLVGKAGLGERTQRLQLQEGVVKRVKVTLSSERARKPAKAAGRKPSPQAAGRVGAEKVMGVGFLVAGGSVLGWLGTWGLSSAKALELSESVHSADEVAQLVREGEAASTASWIFGGAVAVGAATGIVGAIVGGEQAKKRKAARALFVPVPTTGGAAILVLGRF